MQYRKLGRSGLKVSPICLGTMMFGQQTGEAESLAIIAAARDAGINFIDTADTYTGGESERVTGKGIAAHRDEWVLATKLANPRGKGPNQRGLSRKWILENCRNSLRKLGTDYIDILYLHKEDHSTPLEETVRALATLVRHGHVRYLGVSNYRSWRIAEICRLCDAEGIDRPIVSQPYYNLLNRQPEVEQLPACAYFGLGVVPYSPIARGVLTGKYLPDAPPPNDSRAARGDKRILQTEMRPESIGIAQAVVAHAAARGIKPAQFAVAWVLNNALVTGVIAGPRTLEQFTDYLPALDYAFTAADEAFVDGLVPAGHSSTHGFTDPNYPVEGRVARVG